jgi:hypothetical protein
MLVEGPPGDITGSIEYTQRAGDGQYLLTAVRVIWVKLFDRPDSVLRKVPSQSWDSLEVARMNS